jgi:histone deacetylase complex regulatory component SIN3
MKYVNYQIVCVASITFCLTCCNKQNEVVRSDDFAPDKSLSSPNSFAREMVESILSMKEFDDPADGYFHAYVLKREAEKKTEPKESFRDLEEALGYLQAVKRRYPDWKTAMVEARSESTKESLIRISKNEQ